MPVRLLDKAVNRHKKTYSFHLIKKALKNALVKLIIKAAIV